MKLLIRVVALTLPLAVRPLVAQDPHLARAMRVLRAAPVIDGHNDLPWTIRNHPAAPGDVNAYDLRKTTPGHTDLARLRKGMVGGQFWSVYIPGDYKDSGFARVQLEQIDIAQEVLRRYPEALREARTSAAMRAAWAQGRIGSVMGMEGGHAIENSLGALRAYYSMGVRYMTLTHNVTLDWADAGNDAPRHGGLTRFGEEVVREMNRLGMLVDLAHTSPSTMSDALNVAEAPVIWSHACARALTDVPRNVPDSILARIPKNGGIVMVTFVPAFLSQKVADHAAARRARVDHLGSQFGADTAAVNRSIRDWDRERPAPRTTIGHVADHIDHIRKVAGVDHVGIGSDYDGVDDLPDGLEDVSKYPALFAELSRRGWSASDLSRLASGNILRVMRQAEVAAARLQRTRPPSTRTITELDGTRTRM